MYKFNHVIVLILLLSVKLILIFTQSNFVDRDNFYIKSYKTVKSLKAIAPLP